MCAITCVRPQPLLLVVCDKQFGPHSAAERAVPVQITRRQASGRVHWPGHTDTRTEGWCKLWPHFSRRKPHLCKHRKPTVLYFLFLSPFLFLFLVEQESSGGKSVFEEQIRMRTWSSENAYWLQKARKLFRAISLRNEGSRIGLVSSAAVVRCLWTSVDS